MTTSTYRILGLASCLAISVAVGGYAGQAEAQQRGGRQATGGTTTTPATMPTPAPAPATPMPIATTPAPATPTTPALPAINPSQFAMNPQQFLQGAGGVQNIMGMLQGGQINPSQIAQGLAGLGGAAGIDPSQITEATQILQGLQGMMQGGQIDPAAVQSIVQGVMGGQMPPGLAQMMNTTDPSALAETLNGIFGGGGSPLVNGGGSSGGGGGGGGGGVSTEGENYELKSLPVSKGPALGSCGGCEDVGEQIKQHYTAVRQVIKNKFIEHRKWIVTEYWRKHILPALMLMAEQLTVVGIQQVEMFGTMLDAKHQLETQRLFQQMTAQAHKDYHPSEGMCTFGTTVRSLAASERKSDLTQIGLAGRMMQRQSSSGEVVSFEGPNSDIESRLVYFARNFCDKADNSNGLEQLCKDASTKPERRNIDVDYTRNIESRLTLDMDFNDEGANSTASGTQQRELEVAQQRQSEAEQLLEDLEEQLADADDQIVRDELRNVAIPAQQQAVADAQNETAAAQDILSSSQESLDKEDVFALSANLFAHNVAPRLLPEQLATDDGRVKLDAAEKYLDLRSIYAKRSVAQNSFAALTAMRSSGDEGSAPYTKALIKELGVADEDEINELLGEKPSYFAQMEVLTKKIYQNPTFYTELYDKPVNVERKGAAIQAISLMQDRDLYNSLLRSEAVLSVLLETMLIREQDKVVAALPRDAGSAGSSSSSTGTGSGP